jgi:hypothetical protein
LSALSATEAARPTETGVPTNTPTATPSPTPNATLEFLSSCTKAVELVVAYSYTSQSTSSAPVGATFPMTWVLKNSGTCPWPAGLQWTYVEGEDFEVDEPIIIEDSVTADEEITLRANLVAPSGVSAHDSIWQLVDADGEPYGDPITFTVRTYVPVTTTPVATSTPVATATSAVVEELNYAFEIQSCEYVGSDYRCQVKLIPYGGGGGPYTMFVFVNPVVELRDRFEYTYFAQARRCSAWNTEIKVIDEATDMTMSRHLYIDPDNYFEGGCTEP